MPDNFHFDIHTIEHNDLSIDYIVDDGVKLYCLCDIINYYNKKNDTEKTVQHIIRNTNFSFIEKYKGVVRHKNKKYLAKYIIHYSYIKKGRNKKAYFMHLELIILSISFDPFFLIRIYELLKDESFDIQNMVDIRELNKEGLCYFIKKPDNIIKIGMTKGSINERLRKYPDNYQLITHIKVNDCVKVEKEIIKYFTEHYENVEGIEYFKGDIDDMLKQFNKICNNL